MAGKRASYGISGQLGATPTLPSHKFPKAGNLGDDDAVYSYCGNGMGVAGIPHEITREQAERDRILDKLDAAIAAGVYKLSSGEPFEFKGA